jgi:HlyD family secretion protein
MRPLLPLFITALCLLSACSETQENGLHGYAEGDFVSIAPDTPGRILSVEIKEGDHVQLGDILVRMEDTSERARLASLTAQLDAATARFDDAAAGARAPEIGAARDQLTQARAAQTEAQDAVGRTRNLFEQGHVSQARLDQAVAAATSSNARVAEMRQRLNIVQLPARDNQLRALQAEVAAVQAELDQATYVLNQRTIIASSDARVNRQIRYAGEQAGPAQPVLSLLPTGAVHAVVFLPEAELAANPVGSVMDVDCDACPAGLTITLTLIDDSAQFTPPIIYSDTERARLVFRAEARFEGVAPPPGTPLRVSVRP